MIGKSRFLRIGTSELVCVRRVDRGVVSNRLRKRGGSPLLGERFVVCFILLFHILEVTGTTH